MWRRSAGCVNTSGQEMRQGCHESERKLPSNSESTPMWVFIYTAWRRLRLPETRRGEVDCGRRVRRWSYSNVRVYTKTHFRSQLRTHDWLKGSESCILLSINRELDATKVSQCLSVVNVFGTAPSAQSAQFCCRKELADIRGYRHVHRGLEGEMSWP